MASTVLNAKFTGFATELLNVASSRVEPYKATYESNKHRIYSLAFWATDNEMTAEEISARVFCRAFSQTSSPSAESLDHVLISVLREIMPVGVLTLNQTEVCSEVANARTNVKRAILERAVVQLPVTERMVFLMHDVESYDHARIANLLGITEEESQVGLHQARLLLRKLIASTKF